MPKFCPKCGKKLKAGAKFCSSCKGVPKPRSSSKPKSSSKSKSVSGSKPASSQPKTLKPTVKKVAPSVRPAPPVRPVPPTRPARPAPPRSVPAPRPVYPPSLPAKKGGMGCGTGCAIGCLIIAIVTFLIIAALVGVGYYFLFMREVEEGGYFDIESESKKQKVVKCSDSIACLDENLKKCARAKGETEIGDFAEVDFKILGKSDDSCVVYAEVTKMKDIPSQLEILPSFILDRILESFSMECLIPKKVYTQGLEDTREYIADNMFDACRGTTIDLLKKFGVEELEYD